VYYAEREFAPRDVTELERYVHSEQIWNDLKSLHGRLRGYEDFKRRLSGERPRAGLLFGWVFPLLEAQNWRLARLAAPVELPVTTRSVYIVTDGLPRDVEANLLHHVSALIYLESARMACRGEYAEPFKSEVVRAAVGHADIFADRENLGLLDRWPPATLSAVLLPAAQSMLEHDRWSGLDKAGRDRRRQGVETIQQYVESKLGAAPAESEP
jgi:hypothetical protein